MRVLLTAFPEIAPDVENPPADVQDVACVEFHVSVVVCPLSTVVGFAECVAVGVNIVQSGGLLVPLLHEPPVQPPLLHVTQEDEEPTHIVGSEQVLQVG